MNIVNATAIQIPAIVNRFKPTHYWMLDGELHIGEGCVCDSCGHNMGSVNSIRLLNPTNGAVSAVKSLLMHHNDISEFAEYTDDGEETCTNCA
jgi:hypothetical protein